MRRIFWPLSWLDVLMAVVIASILIAETLYAWQQYAECQHHGGHLVYGRFLDGDVCQMKE